MGTTERKQRQRDEVYDSILRAAWKLVKSEGWQGLSIRKIAEAIEYSIPVIYDHFENKEAILREFTRQGFSLLNNQIRQSRPAENLSVLSINNMALAYWDFAMNNQEYYQLMYGLGMPSCETVNEMPELLEFTELVRGVMKTMMKESNEADSFIKMKSFWSMMHGLVSINMMSPHAADKSPALEVLNVSINNFIAGFDHYTTSKN
jgi:AcrR family transcriptional regulator